MNGSASTAGLVKRLQEARVLVLGDVMLDRFVRGNVQRISPEAPIPVVRVESESLMLGGAGNVARNVAALGAKSILVGLVGDDMAGRAVADLAAESDGLEVHLVTVPGRRTTVKTRYVAGAQQLLRTDEEDRGQLEVDTAVMLRKAVEEVLTGVEVVVLSDYAKGALGSATCLAVISRARDAGLPVIVDPKGTDYSRYSGVTVLTPNAKELTAATGLAVTTDVEVEHAARKLLVATKAKAVLVTRGNRGMSIVEAESVSHLKVRAREVFDVSGAGDTVAAVLAASIAVGANLPEAAELANTAAGIVVGKAGTAVAYPREMVAGLQATELMVADEKINPLSAAIEHIERWRRSGETIAFTNGCFDLVHPGHVSLLRQARELADHLVVGLNTDASVRLLKGEDRPVQSETARAVVLASFADVDMVVPFSEQTPLQLIEALQPDILVKGADYTLETVVGADLVQGYGGRVVLARLEPGHSSSGIFARAGKGRAET